MIGTDFFKKKKNKRSEEIQNSIIRIVICGGDSYVNHILRTYGDILSKRSRGMQTPVFYLVPTGKKNDVALHIASVDSVYRNLFFSTDWRDMLEKSEEIIDRKNHIKISIIKPCSLK